MAQLPPSLRRPPLWSVMPIYLGNALQLIGLLLGVWFLYLAAGVVPVSTARVVVMLLAWLVIYLYTHAIAHWAVGRLVGIRFRGYGLRGTDHPEVYPPGVRAVMSFTPFFVALTEKASMQQASPTAKALMFAAGETSTTVCTLVAAWFAWRLGIPGGYALLIFSIVWNFGATLITSIVPTGDYAKARAALRGARP